MKTIEIKLYKFEELSEQAQQKAIESNREINVEGFDWYGCTYDDFKEKAKNIGFDVDKIYFCGFWSQGDGAMFEGSINQNLWDNIETNDPNIKRVLKQLKKGNIYFSGGFKHYGHYYHEKSYVNTMSIEPDGGTHRERIEEALISLEDIICRFYESNCKSLYQDLQSEYEWHTSDNAVKEMLIENEYDFTEDGEMY